MITPWEGAQKSPEVELENVKFDGKIRFVIDTGAELSLIKWRCVKPGVEINERKKCQLFGINKTGVTTYGEIEVKINNEKQLMQVVRDNLSIPQGGILGMPFLKNSIINLKDNILNHENGNLILSVEQKGVILKIQARTKKLVEIPIINSLKLKSGYLPLIPSGPGVYLGEALVTPKEGKVSVFCINTTSQDLELTIHPIKILDFEEIAAGPRTVKQLRINKEVKEVENERMEKLLKMINLDHLNKPERDELLRIIKIYNCQFHLPEDNLGCTKDVQHSIETVDDSPVNSKYSRYPEVHKEEIRKQTEDLLKNKSIIPSKSPYNSPVWIVPKKEDSGGNRRWRMVIDYRKLNEKTINDFYPLPNITETLDYLGQTKYFSVLDLAQGFHQVEVNPKDRHKTAFSTPYGYYEFNRMPFGLKNSPSTFQRMMDRTLSGLQSIELFVYIDDIVIFAKSLQEHSEKLKKLLGRLKTAGLVLQPEKCKFLCKEIGYLGHIVSEHGLKPDPKKVEAVRNFPTPKNRKNIKQFLGLAGYYRRFIPNFAQKAKPFAHH